MIQKKYLVTNESINGGHRDMWQKRSHMLAPLTILVVPLVKYKWGPEQQKLFDEIKQKVSQETLLAFPDFEI
jgi:hypothetical protein